MNVIYENVTRIKTRYSVLLLQNYANEPREMAGLHWHNVYEILYVRRGNGKQRLNAETFSIHPGDIIFIQPGDLHATKSTSVDGCDIDVIQFLDTILFDKEYVSSRISSGIIRQENSYISRIFEAIRRYNSDKDADYEIVMAGLAQILVGFIMQACECEKIPISPMIESICIHLEKTDNLKLNYVANKFGYTPEHLSRKFHKETGVSYRSWCQRIRMQRAIKLLADRKYTISDIAEILQFSNESSFIRAFKHTYKTTPGVWRNYNFSPFGDNWKTINEQP